MPAPTIYINYQNMAIMSRYFEEKGAEVRRIRKRVETQVDILRHGAWHSRAADKFYAEIVFTFDVFDRLQRALEVATPQTIVEIVNTFRRAEQDGRDALPPVGALDKAVGKATDDSHSKAGGQDRSQDFDFDEGLDEFYNNLLGNGAVMPFPGGGGRPQGNGNARLIAALAAAAAAAAAVAAGASSGLPGGGGGNPWENWGLDRDNSASGGNANGSTLQEQQSPGILADPLDNGQQGAGIVADPLDSGTAPEQGGFGLLEEDPLAGVLADPADDGIDQWQDGGFDLFPDDAFPPILEAASNASEQQVIEEVLNRPTTHANGRHYLSEGAQSTLFGVPPRTEPYPEALIQGNDGRYTAIEVKNRSEVEMADLLPKFRSLVARAEDAGISLSALELHVRTGYTFDDTTYSVDAQGFLTRNGVRQRYGGLPIRVTEHDFQPEQSGTQTAS